MAKLFTPSSTDLLNMIKAAEAKCAADIEQTALRIEARAEARYVRAQVAESETRGRIQRWGC